MSALIKAVYERDVPAVLACFSPSSPFYLRDTGSKKVRRSKYTFSQLDAGLKPEGVFREVLLGETADDNLRDEIEKTHRRPWRARGANIFIPSDDARIFVKWRKEGGRFAVDEIGFP